MTPRTYTKEEIAEIVELHRKWDRSEAGGSRAYLREAYLSGAYLSGAYLSGADLIGADLRGEYEGKRLRINWLSHALLSEILLRAAGEDIEKRKVAGLIAVSTDWCWSEFGTLTTDPLFGWAMDEFATWVTPDDGAPEIVRARMKVEQVGAMIAATPRLTKRQRQVLLLCMEGLYAKEMAQQLGVSKRTVDFHLSEVFRLLGVRNRMQAINKARQLGLLEVA